MAAPYNPPNKNEDFIFSIQLADMANPGSMKSSPTIAAGDFKVSKDGGALNDLTSLPAVAPAASTWVTISMSATEMNADRVQIQAIDQTSLKEWADWGVCILTTTP